MGDARIEKWMEWEFRSLNRGVVTRKRTLAALLVDPDLACETREGGSYPIGRGALDRLAAALSPEEHGALRLPITIHLSADHEDEGYVTDPVAAGALRRAEGFTEAFPYRDGRMYLPRSLALDLMSRYEGALQPLFL